MADVVVTNDVDTFLRSADNAEARTNLEVYSEAEVDAKVATKAVAGGVEFAKFDSGVATGMATIPVNPADLLFGNYSFSLWIKINEFPSSVTNIVGGAPTGDAGRIGLSLSNNGNVIFAERDGTTALTGAATNSLLSLDTLYHISAIATSKTYKLYINGVEQTATNVYQAMGENIGSYLYFNERPASGASAGISMRDFRIFNRALSAAEVADLYESGTVAVADRWGNPTPAEDDMSADNTSDWVAADSTIAFDTDKYVWTYTTATQQLHYTASPILLRNGQKVRYTLEIKDGTATGVSIQAFVGNGTSSGQSFGEIGVTDANWTTHTLETIVNTGGDATRIYPGLFASMTSGDIEIRNFKVDILGAIAELPLDEGIGYQFHDRSSNHFDALASTSGVTHLVPKTEGYIRDFNVDAYNGGSGDVQLVDSSRDILVNNVILISAEVHNKTTGTGISSNTIDIVKNNRTFDDFSLSTVHASVNSDAAVYIPLSGAQQFDLDNRKNIKISSSDADATDLNIRVDYKVIE